MTRGNLSMVSMLKKEEDKSNRPQNLASVAVNME